MLLVQSTELGNRRVGVLTDGGERVRILENYPSTYALALDAIAQKCTLAELVDKSVGNDYVGYDELARNGRLLAPLDHPDAAHCFVTGTGLTHLGSADARDSMHKKIDGPEHSLSDSMKMFRMGVEGGKPKDGATGVQPEWFYKGDGTIVAAPGRPLTMPGFSLDGGEEPEIAGMYVIGEDGTPYRLGFAIGNEFSDHVTERQNYLYLAHSKLRECAIGPALRVGELPRDVAGTSRILDINGKVRWEKPFVSGEDNMSHSIANLEYHHFKYPLFCRPGDVHIHFYGTATLSFADGIQVQPGETFEIAAKEFGPPLRSTLAVADCPRPLIKSL